MASPPGARYGSPVNYRVLLIEDDRLSATILSDGLRALGWEVEVESTGPAGLARALRWRPEAVISDLALPGLDGATITATLRMSPGLPIALLLVSAREGGAELARESGAHRFMPKPISAEAAHSALVDIIAGFTAEPTVRPLGPVRLPSPNTLGVVAPEPELERGKVVPGWLAPLLLRLYDRRATGVIDVEGARDHAKIFVHRGAPAASRSSAAGTELGSILERLGFLTPELVESAVAESRQRRRALGEHLVLDAQLDRDTAERALREQVLVRLEAVNAWSSGTWSFSGAQPLGLAGHEVPAGLAYWRLGADVKGAKPPPGTWVRLRAPAWMWPLFEEQGRHAGLCELLRRSAVTTEAVRASGPDGARVLRVFHRFGLVSYLDAPPAEATPGAATAPIDVAELEATIAREQRALADADHYTLLGLPPDAEASEVFIAGLAALARYNPDSLPASVSQVTRGRAQTMYARAVEANRVLTDAARRGLYDAILARRGWRSEGRDEPAGALLLAERAQAAFGRGEYVSASRLFLEALKLEPEDPGVLAMLGQARRLACPGGPDAGEPELRAAVALAPDDEFALSALARLLADRGDLNEARELLRHLLAKNPEYEPAREAMRLLTT